MQPEAIRDALGDLPHMTLAQGRRVHEFIVEHRLADCLELGFYHGVSSAYIAGAIDDLARGHLVTIDAEYARTLDPDITRVLARTGLARHVTHHFEPTSYTWRLMRLLEDDPTPRFDFCYLDGAHTWDDDGFAFFLVERLLRPGGWLLLDDLDWTFDNSPTLRATPRVQAMPPAQRTTPQVRKVYELLVKPHPRFDRFVEEGPWAFARKSPASEAAAQVRTEVVVRSGLGPALGQMRAQLRHRLGGMLKG
jgi:predicted O-methyltransferase YrrM